MKISRPLKIGKSIPMSFVLVVFTLTYFIYKDFEIRMLFGYGILGMILFANISLALFKGRMVEYSHYEMLYLLLAAVILLCCLRIETVFTYDLITYLIAMNLSVLFVLTGNIEKKQIVLIFKIIVCVSLIFAFWEFLVQSNPDIFYKTIYPYMSIESQKYNARMLSRGFGISFGGSLTYTEYVWVLGIAVTLGNLITVQEKHKKMGYLCMLIIYLMAVLVIGRRGELLATLFTITLLIFLLANIRKKVLLIFGGGVILAGIVIACMYWLPALKNVDFLYRYIFTIEGLLEGKDITSGRMELYQIAFQQYLNSPLNGIGWGNFAYLVPEAFQQLHGEVKDVHNIYLQFFCENGTIGALPIISILLLLYTKTICILKKAWKNFSVNHDSKSKLYLKCAIFSMVVQTFFLTTGMLDPVFSKLIFWFFYGLALKMGMKACKLGEELEENYSKIQRFVN